MAKLSLDTAYSGTLPVVIRNRHLDEVWRGLIERHEQQEVELIDGDYLLEINGADGLIRRPLQVQGVSQSILIGEFIEELPHEVEESPVPFEDELSEFLDEVDVDFDVGFDGVAADGYEGVFEPSSESADAVASHEMSSEEDEFLAESSPVYLEYPSSKHLRRTVKKAVAKRFTTDNARVGSERGGPIAGSESESSARSFDVRLSIWTLSESQRWHLEQNPTHDLLFTDAENQRFLSINGESWPSVLVALPNAIDSIAIATQVERATQIVITQSSTDLMTLRAMIERFEHRQAALVAAKLAMSANLDGTLVAAQVSTVLATMINELEDDMRPLFSWFKNLAERPLALAEPLIAYAWLGLYYGEVDQDVAAKALVASVERGLPTMTLSLQLLLRGLELLSYDGADESVITARNTVRDWANHSQADAFFTTLVGRDKRLLMNSTHGADLLGTGHLFGTPIEQFDGITEDGFYVIERTLDA